MARRSQKAEPPPPLHQLEAQVMDEVWTRDEATVRDVLTALNQRHKQRAYTTVMTIMSRLDEKGLLTRTRRGRSDVYEPSMTRERYRDLRAQAEVAALVDEFGDVALAHFADQVGTLDQKRLRALRKLADRA